MYFSEERPVFNAGRQPESSKSIHEGEPPNPALRQQPGQFLKSKLINHIVPCLQIRIHDGHSKPTTRPSGNFRVADHPDRESQSHPSHQLHSWAPLLFLHGVFLEKVVRGLLKLRPKLFGLEDPSG